MNKRNLILILMAIATATSALAVSGGGSIGRKSPQQDRATVSSPSGLKQKPEEDGKPVSGPVQPNQPEQNAEARSQDQTIPQHVVYGQMFRHIKELKKKAGEEERLGKDGSHLRTLYKRMAKLEDHQASVIDQIATETETEIEKLNIKAKKIIDEHRGRHPDGKLAPGELPPSAPAELKMLADERRNLILQARERLRSALGEEEFQKFDKFVEERIKPGIRRLDASGASSSSGSPGQQP